MKSVKNFIRMFVLVLASVFLMTSPVVFAEEATSAEEAIQDVAHNDDNVDHTNGDPCGPNQWKNGLNAIYKYKCVMGNGLSNKDILGKDGVLVMAINFLLYFVGAITIIMLIYGGIRYVISGGDKDKVSSAKNTIIYALLGLALAILSWTLVNFVFTNLGGGTAI